MYILRLVICIVVVLSEFYIFHTYTMVIYSAYDYWDVTLSVLFMAMITGAIGAIPIPLIVHKVFRRIRYKNALNVGIMTFVILVILAILCGPYSAIYVFNNRALISFFSEALFLNYIFEVALPFSFVSALLEFIFGKKYAVVIPIKPYSQNDDKILKL